VTFKKGEIYLLFLLKVLLSVKQCLVLLKLNLAVVADRNGLFIGNDTKL
jgi:hypothetical protein